MRQVRSASAPTSPAETITKTIIERLEAGVRPWRQPWTGGSVSRPLRVCGTPYRGINVIWLWMAAQARGFASPTWMTYHQSQLLGGQVRKGERGTIAIFYKSYTKTVEDAASGEAEHESRRVLKSFTVFNVNQIDGLPERFRPEPVELPEPTARDHALDAFFAAIPAAVRHGGGEAYYLPSADEITSEGSHGALADGSAATPTPWKNWSPSWHPPWSVPNSGCRSTTSTIMRATWPPGSRC